jgi:hypothetical protein
MPEFWKLASPASNEKRASWTEETHFAGATCPANPGHRSPGPRATALSVYLPGNSAADLDDFIWTWYSECILHERTLELFQKEKITGFEVKPVTARFKARPNEPVPPLWELVVTGWAGIATPESGISLDLSCPACGRLHYSNYTNPEVLFNPAQWDGSDVFMIWPLPRYVFISDRVAQLVRRLKLTGVQLVDPKELKSPGRQGISPGRLSYYMPKARAEELGKPFGID